MPCDLHPIALCAATLEGIAPGTELPDILNGTDRGNFGWLSWEGSPSVPMLVDSLSRTALGSAYVNPHNPDDREFLLGDWVWGKLGVSNSKHVCRALDALASQDITVPIWDEASGSGQNVKANGGLCLGSSFGVGRVGRAKSRVMWLLQLMRGALYRPRNIYQSWICSGISSGGTSPAGLP